ncbi:MAG: MFS transporter [Chloroflexi bacterium]|nr:MFS transporter [Chloroflexota bacterium]
MRASLLKHPNLMVGALSTTYGLFYLGRANISVVLPIIALDLNLSLAEVGALGTVFYWIYGIFQLISGEIGSHVSPFRIISLGLLATAIVNLAFSLQTSLIAMLLLWGINGMAQSGGWSPMARIMAERLPPARLKHASTLMPFGYVIGTAVTWTLIGAVSAGQNWRIAFWLPGLLLLLVLVLWRLAGIDAPKAVPSRFRPSTVLAQARGIAFIMIAAALVGFVRNGSLIWLPTYILDTGLIAENLVGMIAALTQIVALLGVILARHRVESSDQVFMTAVLMSCAAGLGFLLLSQMSGLVAILVLALALMMLNGAYGLAITSIPLMRSPRGRASSIAGTVNMMATLIGGTAGFVIGGLVEFSGWAAVFGLWGGLLLLASFVIWRRRHEEDSGAARE